VLGGVRFAQFPHRTSTPDPWRCLTLHDAHRLSLLGFRRQRRETRVSREPRHPGYGPVTHRGISRSGLLPCYSLLHPPGYGRRTKASFPPFILRGAGLRLLHLFHNRWAATKWARRGYSIHSSDDNPVYCQRKHWPFQPECCHSSNPGTVKARETFQSSTRPRHDRKSIFAMFILRSPKR
jgi:hypothetical protein